jgi:carboxylate-amine ligase
LKVAEWAWLETALAQRARALNAFIADVYADQRIVSAGVIGLQRIRGAGHFEPAIEGVEVSEGHAPVVGFDLVRGADGKLRVLEDNLRTPSGLGYASAVRSAVTSAHGNAPRLAYPLDDCFHALRRFLFSAAYCAGDPEVALLSDGPSNSAWYEHRLLARRLGISLVVPEQLRLDQGRLCVRLPSGKLRPIDVLYRRTDEDRLRDEEGRPTWLAEVLLEPLRAGRLAVVNAPGSGVADDKLIHAYVEEMVRLYLGEEPLIESVRTYDLMRPELLTRVLGRFSGAVIKPRTGHGGQGVFIAGHASAADRAKVAAAVKAAPHQFVAQETVQLSRHPTVVGDRLEPRHVDLRVFVVGTGATTAVVPPERLPDRQQLPGRRREGHLDSRLAPPRG